VLSGRFKYLIVDNHHGFIEGRSTLSNLVYVIRYVSNFVCNHGQIQIIIYTVSFKGFGKLNVE
jgi:hypothetical protein